MMFLFFIYALSVQLANGQTVSYTPPNPSFPIGVKTIAVNGFGTSSAISDLASVSFGVQADAIEAIDARARATALVDSITADLQQKYSTNQSLTITTSSLYVYPQYGYNSTTFESFITGYTFYINLFATLRNITADSVAGLSHDMPGIAEVVDAIITAGHSDSASGQTSVYNIQFSLSDNLSGALYRSARKSAALDAVFTAQEYTSYLGLVLGDLISLEESTTDSGTAGPFTQPSTSLDISVPTYTNGSTPITLTPQAVNVRVHAVFALNGPATSPPAVLPPSPSPLPSSLPPEASAPVPAFQATPLLP